MDNIKNQYKKQMDSYCQENLKLTAEDILKATPKAAVTDLSGAKKKMNIKTKIASIAAACVLTTGLTGVVAGAAGIGPMKEIVPNIFTPKTQTAQSDSKQAADDKVSEKLVDEGYLLNINETKSAMGYDVTLQGITGDITNPQLLFKIKVNDETFTKANKSFVATVYTGLSEDAYANRYDVNESVGSYMYTTATAVQDSNDTSIYYLSMPGNVYWMTSGNDVVVEFRSIRENCTGDTWDNETMLNLVYRFTMPSDGSALKTVAIYNYEFGETKAFVSDSGIKFYLQEADFGAYDTTIVFQYDLQDTKLDYITSDFWGNYDAVQNEINKVGGEITLVVDGTEYKMTSVGGCYCDEKGEFGPKFRTHWTTSFASINFDAAKEIVLKYRNTMIVIKGEDSSKEPEIVIEDPAIPVEDPIENPTEPIEEPVVEPIDPEVPVQTEAPVED